MRSRLSPNTTSYLFEPKSPLKNDIILSQIDGFGGCATNTCADAETVTWPLPAVKVYMVVVIGDTILVPFKATLPIPRSILTVVAFETLQLNVAISPGVMIPGLDEKVRTDGGCIGGVGVGVGSGVVVGVEPETDGGHRGSIGLGAVAGADVGDGDGPGITSYVNV